MSPIDLDAHYEFIAGKLEHGRLVPFLGAGANMVGREASSRWDPGRSLPSALELATYLSQRFRLGDDGTDLARVSQFVCEKNDVLTLLDELAGVFRADSEPGRVQCFLADLGSRLRRRGGRPLPLVVTTNYDDALERAFAAQNEPFDLVWYLSAGGDRGRFVHLPCEGDPRIIEVPNEYDALDPETRTVILKLHGSIDASGGGHDSFVISEDDYLDYLTRADATTLFPAEIGKRFRLGTFLFLGYSLRDWNVRVMLHRIQRANGSASRVPSSSMRPRSRSSTGATGAPRSSRWTPARTWTGSRWRLRHARRSGSRHE